MTLTNHIHNIVPHHLFDEHKPQVQQSLIATPITYSLTCEKAFRKYH